MVMPFLPESSLTIGATGTRFLSEADHAFVIDPGVSVQLLGNAELYIVRPSDLVQGQQRRTLSPRCETTTVTPTGSTTNIVEGRDCEKLAP